MLTLNSPKSVYTDTITFFKSDGTTPTNMLRQDISFSKLPKLSKSNLSAIAHQFSDYHLAYRARLCLITKVANFQGYLELNESLLPQTCTKFNEMTFQRSKQFLYKLLRPKSDQQQLICMEFLEKLKQYDENMDKLVTYNQFVSFFMDVCLPALSLTNLNQQSQTRITGQIPKPQFIIALKTQLQLIKCKINQNQLSIIFEEICQNNQQTISIQRYNEFIRGYFGKQGIAAKHDSLSEIQQPQLTTDTKNYNEILQRISKITFKQLHKRIIDFDSQQNLGLKRIQITQLIEKLFNRMVKLNRIQIQKKMLFTYDEVLMIIVTEIFEKSGENAQNRQEVGKLEFVDRVLKNTLNWMKIKPSKYLFEEIFQYLCNKYGQFTTQQYHQFLKDLAHFHINNHKST